MVRGVRGAVTVGADTPQEVAQATRELLEVIVARNGISPADIAAATFSVTDDVRSAFPAATARALGWTMVPMECYQEMSVPQALPRCIRVLILWNTDKPQNEIQHVYLREAVGLRPDLAK